MRISEGDVHNTTFKTQYEHFEFIVTPFGLTNASVEFMSLINKVFSAYLDKFVGVMKYWFILRISLNMRHIYV